MSLEPLGPAPQGSQTQHFKTEEVKKDLGPLSRLLAFAYAFFESIRNLPSIAFESDCSILGGTTPQEFHLTPPAPSKPILSPAPSKTPQAKNIKNMVISGGGAKGAVLPGAFEIIYNKHPEFIKNLDRIAGSSVGAITAALIATGGTLQDLQAISDQNFENLLGPERTNKPASELTNLIRTTIENNIKNRLKNLSQEELNALAQYPDLTALIECIEKNHTLPKITFRILSILQNKHPDIFKGLSITATEKTRGLFIFDETNSPDVEIAIACRASASIPILFEPVSLPLAQFPPNHPWGTTPPVFFDGAMTDNVPIKEIEKRYASQTAEEKQKKGLKKQAREETIVLVFEESTKDGKSTFDPTSPQAPYTPTRKDRLLRDFFVPRFAGLELSTPNTQTKAKTLNHIKKKCQGNILSFQTDLQTTDFAKATRDKETYKEVGRAAARAFRFA